jgi:hypothetical protein
MGLHFLTILAIYSIMAILIARGKKLWSTQQVEQDIF